MTVDPRHDFHPNAESLSAFAESALGAQERREIVSHLAECGRCREIVFLAQEAAGEMEMEPQLVAAAAAPQLNTAAKPKVWFRSWRFAWVPAGVLVAMVTVAYVVHVRRLELISEFAKAEPGKALQDQLSAAKPSAAPVTQPRTVVAAPESAGKKVKGSELGGAPGEAAFPKAAPSGVSDSQRLSESAAPAMPPLAAPPTPATAEQYVVVAPSAADQKQLEQNTATMQMDQLTAKPMPRAKTAGAVHGQAIGRGLAVAAAPTPKSDANSKSSTSLVAGGQSMASGAFAAYEARPMELPSGLVAISTGVANERTVAVDAKGAVFVREGSDGQWEAVPKQWSGLAVTVRLQAEDGGASPARVFEIVNDLGQVWVSTNGKIWAAK